MVDHVKVGSTMSICLLGDEIGDVHAHYMRIEIKFNFNTRLKVVWNGVRNNRMILIRWRLI